MTISNESQFATNNILFRSVVKEKEDNMSEMKTKFSKHRQILTSNWQQAEDEVFR